MPEITLERRLLERTAPRLDCHPNLLSRRGVDGGEEVRLAARVERLRVVKHDQIRRGALRRAEQMAAAAARLAPEVHDRFAKAALGKRAHARERLGVRSSDEVLEARLGCR